jgi:signal transduction histidine kinase
MRRATLDMKNMIEMFLCLARETDDGLYNEQFSVAPLVYKAIDQQRYLLRGKSVDIELDEAANPSVFGHPQAFSIAVTNLVRNAFEHTLDNHGPVSVVIKDNELIVSNHTNQHVSQQVTFPAESHITNNGLGLGIVQRLSEKNNWTFSLSTSENLVVARLCW